MRFLKNEPEKIKEYFQNNSITILVVTNFSLIIAFCGALYKIFTNKTHFVVMLIILLILFTTLFTLIRHINNNYINIKNLYLDNDTYLINTITSIMETKKLKRNDNINCVNIKELKCTYIISDIDTNCPNQSNLDVFWEISSDLLHKKLINYHIIYTKDKMITPSVPKVTIQEFNNKYTATIENQENDLLNHFKTVFRDGNLPANSRFTITIELNDYYKFLWNDNEVLIINAPLWGKTIKETNIKLLFKTSKIENVVISVYKVSQINFKRKLIQQTDCGKNDSGDYEYNFTYDKKVSNEFFIIKIPKVL